MTEDMIELFNRVQDDLNLTRVELNNLSSLTNEASNAGKDYLSIMYENLAVLETMAEAVAQPAVPQEEVIDAEAADSENGETSETTDAAQTSETATTD